MSKFKYWVVHILPAKEQEKAKGREVWKPKYFCSSRHTFNSLLPVNTLSHSHPPILAHDKSGAFWGVLPDLFWPLVPTLQDVPACSCLLHLPDKDWNTLSAVAPLSSPLSRFHFLVFNISFGSWEGKEVTRVLNYPSWIRSQKRPITYIMSFSSNVASGHKIKTLFSSASEHKTRSYFLSVYKVWWHDFYPTQWFDYSALLGGPKGEVLAAFNSSLPPQPSSCTRIVFLTQATQHGHMCSQKLLWEAPAAAAAHIRQCPTQVSPINVPRGWGCCLQTSQSFSSSRYQNIEHLLDSVLCCSLISVPKAILSVPRTS